MLTQDRKESLKKPITPAEALDEDSMEEAVACLIATTNETIENESWLGSKRSTFRVQKATLSVKDRVSKVEEFSNYLISPMRKRYDVVFRSTTVTFKAIICWLNLEMSDKAPRDWVRKRQAISERIQDLTRCPKKEATIEEIASDDTKRDDAKFERTPQDAPKVKTLNRVEIDDRLNDIPGALAYNILKKRTIEAYSNGNHTQA